MSYKADLNHLRTQIDRVDSDLISLLQKRATLVKKVELLKFSHGIPVLDSTREAAILDSMAARGHGGPLPETDLKAIMKAIVVRCRKLAKNLRAGRK